MNKNIHLQIFKKEILEKSFERGNFSCLCEQKINYSQNFRRENREEKKKRKKII